MEDKNDDIGKLFKKAFEGHKAPPSNEEWELVSSSLVKHNFFKFNPYQFNVYYVSCIVVCLFICVGVGSHYTYKHFVEPEFTQTIEIQTTISSGDSSDYASLEEEGRSNQKNKTNSGKILPPLNESPKKGDKSSVFDQKSSLNSSQSSSKIDTLLLKPHTKEHTTQVDSISAPVKRTLYITKRDTIFRFDTIKTHKKQRKWLR